MGRPVGSSFRTVGPSGEGEPIRHGRMAGDGSNDYPDEPCACCVGRRLLLAKAAAWFEETWFDPAAAVGFEANQVRIILCGSASSWGLPQRSVAGSPSTRERADRLRLPRLWIRSVAGRLWRSHRYSRRVGCRRCLSRPQTGGIGSCAMPVEGVLALPGRSRPGGGTGPGRVGGSPVMAMSEFGSSDIT